MFPNKQEVSDCVHYRIFLSPSEPSSSTNTSDLSSSSSSVYSSTSSTLPATSPASLFLARLVGLRHRILDFVAKETSAYLWHRDPFSLELCLASDDADRFPISTPHLYGMTRFGDNIEDEWFIVYLLLKITKLNNNITVRIVDNDGQFLLIESADFLPEWVDPEISDSRVFLQKGGVHILPQKGSKPEISKQLKNLTPDFALAAIQGFHGSLKTSYSEIDKAIQARLKGYPQRAIAQSSHYVRVFLPHAAACVFEKFPSLINKAAHLFYYRDSVDLRATRTMKKFGPQVENNLPMRWIKIKLTRCMYAQLLGQKFYATKVLAPFFPVVPSSDSKARGIDLGMKLLCGLEMYYQTASARNQKQQSKNESKSKPSSTSSPAEVDLLKSSPFVTACLETMSASSSSNTSNNTTSLTPVQLDELFHALTHSSNQSSDSFEKEWCLNDDQNANEVIDSLLAEENVLPAELASFDSLGADDDESWLGVDAQELEEMLRGKEVSGLEASEIKGHTDMFGQTTSQRAKKTETKSSSTSTTSSSTASNSSSSSASSSSAASPSSSSTTSSTPNKISNKKVSFDKDASVPAASDSKELKNKEHNESAKTAQASESLAHVARGVSDFMTQQSSYEGVVQPQHLSIFDKNKKSKGSTSSCNKVKKDDQEVEFDLSKLLAALEGDIKRGQGNPSFNAALKRLGVDNTELLPDTDSDRDDQKVKDGEIEDEGDEYRDEGDEGDDMGEAEGDGNEVDMDDIDEENHNLRMLMEAMDHELHGEGIGKEFERAPANEAEKTQGEEEFQPVEVNLNLVKNLLESYSSQAGEAGPVGNLLSQLGLSLPNDLPNDLD